MTDRLYRHVGSHQVNEGVDGFGVPIEDYEEVVLAVCGTCDGNGLVRNLVRDYAHDDEFDDCPDCYPDKDGRPSGFVVEAR